MLYYNSIIFCADSLICFTDNKNEWTFSKTPKSVYYRHALVAFAMFFTDRSFVNSGNPELSEIFYNWGCAVYKKN